MQKRKYYSEISLQSIKNNRLIHLMPVNRREHTSNSRRNIGVNWISPKNNKHPVLGSRKRTFLFRGQKDAEWELETSLDRFLKQIHKSDKKKVEPYLIEEFQRRYRNYANNVPNRNNKIEWWALMQHYGAPTRLLDWTHSYFVALFFALEDIENRNKQSAVWAIDADWLREKYKENLELTATLTNDPHMSRIATFKQFNDKPIILRLNPFLLHERLSVQQGRFLIPGKVPVSFSDNLIEFAGGKNILKKYIYKIIIPKDQELRKNRLEDLFRMNISRASLFPDLEGYARSLRTLTYSMPKLLNKPEFLERIH